MNKNRYFIVGLFIVLASVAMMFISFWLAFGFKDTKYNTYVSHFYEPVNGLNVNSDINYNGVNVGKVESIKIDSKNPRAVIVTMLIKDGIPIYKNTYSGLMPQGITGQVYINLSIDGDSPLQINPPRTTAPYTSIKSKASFLRNTVEQISKILDDQKIDDIAAIIRNLKKTTDNIVNNNNISQSIQYLHTILKNTAKSSNNLNEVIDNIGKTSKSIADSANQIIKITSTLTNQTIQSINNIVLPKMSNTLSNINQGVQQATYLMNTLNKNPSALIRGTKQIHNGEIDE